ncbi:MAG: AMP-binding protein [Rubrivivax sp.]
MRELQAPAVPAGIVSTLQGPLGTDARTGRRRTLPQLLLDQAAAQGGKPYLRRKYKGIWQDTSWQAFVDEVTTIAHALRRRGLRAGDVVAMLSDNLPELYAIELAAHCVGACVTCLYPDESPANLRYVLEHSGARLLFAQDQEQVDKALALGAAVGRVETIVYIEERGLWSYDDPRLVALQALRDGGRQPTAEESDALQRTIREAQDTEAAALCYTSGTTGQPKAAVFSHRYVLDNAYRLMAALQIAAGTKYLSYMSLSWAPEQIGLGLGLLAPMIVHFSETAASVQADLREVGVEFLLFSPRQWEMMDSAVGATMLQAGPLRRRLVDWATREGLRAVRTGRSGWRHALAKVVALTAIRDNMGVKYVKYALCAGSGMSTEIFDHFHALGVPLRNLYGYSEHGMLSAHYGERDDPATIGHLLPIDPTLGVPLEFALTAEGELLVKGGSGVSPYLNAPEQTAAGMDGDWHRSGDAVRLDAQGELIYLDRVKYLKRLRSGHRFPPQFIENQLRASPYVRDALVLGDESREHVAVLVNIDETVVSRFAEMHGIAWRTFTDLSQHREVHALVGQVIRAVNERLDAHARVLRFATFPKDLDPDDGELTRSRKLRREVIEERYRPLIDAIYGGSRSCALEVQVRYADGAVSRLRQDVLISEGT